MTNLNLDEFLRLRRPVDVEIRDLIHKMATENAWGAPKIHELLPLGFDAR